VAGALGPAEFMWGTQCDYSQNGGVWDIWSQDQGKWVPMYSMPCVNPNRSKFRTGAWYHVIWSLHRVAPGLNLPYGGMSFDSVRIVEYAGDWGGVIGLHLPSEFCAARRRAAGRLERPARGTVPDLT
jgi:hypothetical protein